MSKRAQIPQTRDSAPPLHFTSAPFGTVQRKCACGGSGGSGRDCPECQRKRMLQRRVAGGSKPATVPPIVRDVLRSPGEPLDSAARAFFEPRFGHDFSRVRVHTDNGAAQSAAAVNAKAYTLGNQVAFGAGEYSPSTERGRHLLAHELAHVVQQSELNTALTDVQVGPTGDAAEKEADRFAEAVIRSESHRAPPKRFPAMLRRTVIVNPPASTAEILGYFNTICPGNFAVTGQNISEHCSASTTQGCECLCDVAHDPSRTYTINVQPAAVGTEPKTLHDGTNATVPSISVWPQTAPGPNPTVTMVAASSPVEFGSFAPDGHAEWAEGWRILEHELCGHARLGGGDGPIGDRPNHDATIDTENAIAAEHGRPARGHYNDLPRQGESFFNPAGNRSKVKFKLKDGDHYEAP